MVMDFMKVMTPPSAYEADTSPRFAQGDNRVAERT